MIGPRYLGLALVAVVAVAIPTIPNFAALVTVDRYIVRVDDIVLEDQYVTSTSGQVEGIVEGDLTIFTGSLTITGEVTGSVTVFSFGRVTVAEGASIGGSLRGTAGSLDIAGVVAGDVFIGAASVVVEPGGVVGRDVMAFGGALTNNGEIGRDVRGRMMRASVGGSVGGDIHIATQSLDVDASGSVGGDILYRSPAEAEIDPSAEISGTITRLPARGNFLYGVIVSLAAVISFFGFIVAGFGALWLLRMSGSRAVGRVLTRPIRTLLVGFLTVMMLPVVVVVLAMTLVGIPLAVIGVLMGGVAFVIGPVPAVTALGNRILWNRGGLFGAFLVGAVVWRLAIWLIPVAGVFVYLLALVWGIGAWVTGLAAVRRGDPTPAALVPASMIVTDKVPDDWEPPLAPRAATPESEAEPDPERGPTQES